MTNPATAQPDPMPEQRGEEAAAEQFFLGDEVQSYIRGRQFTTRHRIIMVAFIALSLYLMWTLRADFAYSVFDRPQVELGRAEQITNSDPRLVEDAFVSVRGILGNRGAKIRRARGLSWPTEYNYLHLLGSKVFLQMPRTTPEGTKRELTQFQDLEVKGRLIRLDPQGRNAALSQFFQQQYLYEPPADSWLIRVDEVPGQQLRYLFLYLFFVAAIAVNVSLLVRSRRPQQVVQANRSR